MWFVFKETKFHRKPTNGQMEAPAQQNVGFSAQEIQNQPQK
jgi:hypothetical protein